jgi:drug/metabolite transporter (DMT)-like permease
VGLSGVPYIGEALSLTTAILWAFAVILFKRSGETVHPLALNLFKSGLAFVLLVPTALLMGVDLFPDLPWSVYAWTALTGLIGIGVADTVFFRSLNILGAGRSAIIEASYAPFVILFSFLWLGERLSAAQGVGSGLIVGAVLVASYTTTRRVGPPLPRSELIEGILWGVVSHGLMALGLVMIKPVLNGQSVFWTTIWRLVGGLFGLGVIVLAHPARRTVLGSLMIRSGWKFMFGGAFIGQYITLLTWLGGMKYTLASISSALNQTSTVFTFVLAALILREAVTKRRLAAIILAVTGVAFVIFG